MTAPDFVFDLRDIRNHPLLVIVLCALWAWVSITLMIRLWLVHCHASFVKKFLWSIVLLVPVLGWMLYAGLFRLPRSRYTLNNDDPGGGEEDHGSFDASE